VAERKKRSKPREEDRLAPYRRIRTPMPPPQQVMRDRRREVQEEQARRDMEER
jgi:hypothetical protein